jgi:hypothetical protein
VLRRHKNCRGIAAHYIYTGQDIGTQTKCLIVSFIGATFPVPTTNRTSLLSLLEILGLQLKTNSIRPFQRYSTDLRSSYIGFSHISLVMATSLTSNKSKNKGQSSKLIPSTMPTSLEAKHATASLEATKENTQCTICGRFRAEQGGHDSLMSVVCLCGTASPSKFPTGMKRKAATAVESYKETSSGSENEREFDQDDIDSILKMQKQRKYQYKTPTPKKVQYLESAPQMEPAEPPRGKKPQKSQTPIAAAATDKGTPRVQAKTVKVNLIATSKNNPQRNSPQLASGSEPVLFDLATSSTSKKNLLSTSSAVSKASHACGDTFCVSTDGRLAAVFDGYTDFGVAKFLGDNFAHCFKAEYEHIRLVKEQTDADVAEEAFRSACKSIHTRITSPQSPIAIHSVNGSDICAVFVIQKASSHQYVCCQLGNAEAVLSRSGKAVHITSELAPEARRPQIGWQDILANIRKSTFPVHRLLC